MRIYNEMEGLASFSWRRVCNFGGATEHDIEPY